MASTGLGPLRRRRASALAYGCGRSGRVVLPLARAAAVSTGLRVRHDSLHVQSVRHVKLVDLHVSARPSPLIGTRASSLPVGREHFVSDDLVSDVLHLLLWLTRTALLLRLRRN